MCTSILMSFKQFSVRKQIIAAIVFTSIFKNVHLQQCGKLQFNKKHFGQRLVGFNISTTTEDSIGTCVKKCFQLNHCLSTNFDTVSKECDLNNITADDEAAAVVKSDTSILSDLRAWSKAVVGSCGDKPCHGRDICLPAGNSFLCRKSDCPKAPSFGASTSTGSVEIGGKMVYKCTQPFHHIIGQDYIQCGWMGTWSSIKEITCTADAMQDCVTPSAHTDGSISGKVFTHDSDVIYNCDAGYKLVGDNTTKCEDGVWGGTTPTCIQDCGPITYPNINVDSIDDTTIGSTAVVYCKPGYQLRYSTVPVSVVCSDDGLGGVGWKAMTEEPECWELMFRGTEDSGDSAANAYMYGITGVTTTDPDCMLVQNNSCTLHYRNPQLDSWSTLGVRKVRYEMYNNGNVEMSLVMNGAGTTFTDWLWYNNTGSWRALEYQWTGLTENSTSWWALNDWDSGKFGRTFRILYGDYSGVCTGDVYYTVVLFGTTKGCNYENHPLWPKFLYTTTNTASAFDLEEYGMASVMAVWVYHD